VAVLSSYAGTGARMHIVNASCHLSWWKALLLIQNYSRDLYVSLFGYLLKKFESQTLKQKNAEKMIKNSETDCFKNNTDT
jgi:hypothetical protein